MVLGVPVFLVLAHAKLKFEVENSMRMFQNSDRKLSKS